MQESFPQQEKKRENFTSALAKADGSHENFSIKLEKDGKPPLLVFEDIDKTLLHIEPTYKEIRKKMWPHEVEKEGLEEFSKVHLDGFRLGTMWRELYRMHGIYQLGKEEWKNPDVYEKEFLAAGKPGEHVDDNGDEYHELADKLLQQFDAIAAEVVEQQAKENPQLFESSKIGPLYKLNAIYKKMGVPVVGMTANPRKFIEALCKYTGLSEQFLDCATDTDVLKAKEYKMQWLAERLEKKGLPIPYDRLLVIGDSPKGDVGSASRFQKLEKEKHPEVSASGILIVEGDADVEKAINVFSENNIDDINIQAFNYKKTPLDEKGDPQLYSKFRELFLSKIQEK